MSQAVKHKTYYYLTHYHSESKHVRDCQRVLVGIYRDIRDAQQVVLQASDKEQYVLQFVEVAVEANVLYAMLDMKTFGFIDWSTEASPTPNVVLQEWRKEKTGEFKPTDTTV